MRNENKGVFLNGFFYYGGEMQINIQNQGALNFQFLEKPETLHIVFWLVDSRVEVITSSAATQLHVDI